MTWLARPRVLISVVAAIVIAVGLWSFISPDPDLGVARLRELGLELREHTWFWLTIFFLVVLGQQLAVPYLVLVALCVIFLGALFGFVVVYVGTLVGATVGFLVGHHFGHDILERFSGPRVEELSNRLARHGTKCMAVANLFPLVPHVVLNLVAGSSGLRFHHFLAGTALGLAPSTLVLVIVTAILIKYARIPTAGEAFVAVLLAGIAAILLWWWGRRVWRSLE